MKWTQVVGGKKVQRNNSRYQQNINLFTSVQNPFIYEKSHEDVLTYQCQKCCEMVAEASRNKTIPMETIGEKGGNMKRENKTTSASVTEECKECRGGFRCYNEKSPCYLYHCGEYPGTGKFEPVTGEEANK